MHIGLHRLNGQIYGVELRAVLHHRALARISALIKHRSPCHARTIEKIQIEDSALNDVDYQALQSIFQRCSNLAVLHMDSNHIDAQNFKSLLETLSFCHLQKMIYCNNWIGDNLTDDYFAALSNQLELQSLDFSSNWLRDQGVAKLMKGLRSDLTVLNLSGNDIHVAGLENIFQYLQDHSKLRVLDLSYNAFDVSAARVLIKIINQCKALNALFIQGNDLNEEGILMMVDALAERAGKLDINLSDNCLKRFDKCGDLAKALHPCSHKTIYLKNNKIEKKKLANCLDKIGGLQRSTRYYI